MKLQGICLLTNDVLRLAKFYEFIFQEKSNGNEVHMQFDKAQLAIWNPSNEKSIKDKTTILMYIVADVYAEFVRLKESDYNINILVEPKQEPWGVTSFSFLDIDGNQINFLTPNEKAFCGERAKGML